MLPVVHFIILSLHPYSIKMGMVVSFIAGLKARGTVEQVLLDNLIVRTGQYGNTMEALLAVIAGLLISAVTVGVPQGVHNWLGEKTTSIINWFYIRRYWVFALLGIVVAVPIYVYFLPIISKFVMWRTTNSTVHFPSPIVDMKPYIHRYSVENAIGKLLFEKSKFGSFHVVTGPKGAGKTSIVAHVTKNINGIIHVPVTSIASQRDLVQLLADKLYCFPNQIAIENGLYSAA